ncbi:uncharacterized protein PpBr36_11224 [Pyricularia pennisetigena]|uniref:uncharacterized protein n=1 Tax=Pyricularia pennisetigena TaxID=1578925 RepID=UPI00115343AE|nr:uncharacterized protein PpBr36_11224 [Pyricularia pennisetigena]TLS20543.1 hypothetical protein PpBr36_11224 [Pyricularia pennisetigena]
MPFCKAQLATASGLIYHLENSTRPKAKFLNLDTFYAPSNPVEKTVTGRTHNEATDDSQCCLCNKVFRESSHLKKHLSSPARFKTVGGLVNHIESESCGSCRFEDGKSRARDLISGKLLKNLQIS